MEYRTDPRGEFWHFCPPCSKWPTELFTVLYLDKPPTLLKLCPECLTLSSTDALTDSPGLPARSPRQTKPWADLSATEWPKRPTYTHRYRSAAESCASGHNLRLNNSIAERVSAPL